jgi:hypothetical protein
VNPAPSWLLLLLFSFFFFFSIRLLLLCSETNCVKNLGIGDWGGSAWFFTPITTSSSKEKNLRIWALGFSLLCPSSINLSYTFFPSRLFVNSVFHEHGERLRIGKQRGQGVKEGGRRVKERGERVVFFFFIKIVYWVAKCYPMYWIILLLPSMKL